MFIMKRNFRNWIIIIASLILVLTIGFYTFKFYDGSLSDDTSNWGAFGNYIAGIIGTSLGLLSVILIYLTYNSQVKYAKEQHENSTLQQFENTFFNLLQVQREILKSLHTKGKSELDNDCNNVDTNLHGSDYIEWISQEIENGLKMVEDLNKLNKQDAQQKIDEVYTAISAKEKAMLCHYFRHLYHIFSYVNESEIKNKKKYINIISAQMDDNELYVTFYNCISHHGFHKFYPILFDYGSMENLDETRNDLLPKHYEMFYKKSSQQSL